MEKFTNKENQSGINLSELTEKYGAIVTAEKNLANAFRIQFSFGDESIKTTVKILFHDKTGSDIVIAHMATWPKEQEHKGFGSQVVQHILEWAKDNNLREIRATQVQSHNESFWTKNGFVKVKEPNPTGDFVYQIK